MSSKNLLAGDYSTVGEYLGAMENEENISEKMKDLIEAIKAANIALNNDNK